MAEQRLNNYGVIQDWNSTNGMYAITEVFTYDANLGITNEDWNTYGTLSTLYEYAGFQYWTDVFGSGDCQADMEDEAYWDNVTCLTSVELNVYMVQYKNATNSAETTTNYDFLTSDFYWGGWFIGSPHCDAYWEESLTFGNLIDLGPVSNLQLIKIEVPES